jgi:heptaprenyl diphosphate synthase
LNKTRKLVLLSILVSTALVLSLVDSRIILIPMLPGVKIGLANIVTMMVIFLFGWKEALVVTAIRCLLSWFFHGSIITLILSLSGGISAALVMAILYKKFSNKLSIVGISMCGAVMHNMGQLLSAGIILQLVYIIYYAPWLLLAGVISGLGTGIIADRILKYFPKDFFFTQNN